MTKAVNPESDHESDYSNDNPRTSNNSEGRSEVLDQAFASDLVYGCSKFFKQNRVIRNLASFNQVQIVVILKRGGSQIVHRHSFQEHYAIRARRQVF